MKQTKRMAMCGMMVTLIVLADITLMLYDFVLPHVEWIMAKKLGKPMKK
ncbi:MAG: hypothetical protein IJE94_03770 [Oscillospiraceae bacterium]|nr:hypothetical protein [Oscillospiraceae bacterium]